MSQYFSFTRFGRLLRKHTTEHLGSYGLGVAVLLGGLVAVMGFLSYLNGGPMSQAGQAAMFMLFLLGAGGFFTSQVLAGYGGGSRAALALTLPASQLEKFLVAWLWSLPVFGVVFVPLFMLAAWLVLSVSGHGADVWNPLANAEELWGIGRSYLLLHGVALWGSIFFRRQQVVRTAFVVLGALAGLFTLNVKLLRQLIGPEVAFALPLGTANLANGLHLTLPAAQTQWLWLVPLALVALLWAAAYHRLTEKQL